MPTFIPLGTASAVPTRNRHLSAGALVREGRVLLFDCGEGTQLQLLEAGVKQMRVDAVFITHLHGDHFFGLFGLISTLALLEREDPLLVVGPAGISDLIEAIPGLQRALLRFPLEVVELHEGLVHEVVVETADYYVEARPIDHRIFAAGFRFQEKLRPGSLDVERARALGVTDFMDFRALKEGRAVATEAGRTIQPGEVVGPERPGASFAFVTDTRPCEEGRLLAQDADLLFHEATFAEDEHERAVATGHSTGREAALIAREAGARHLLLGHFSARYIDPAAIVAEARENFKNTHAAQELKRYAF